MRRKVDIEAKKMDALHQLRSSDEPVKRAGLVVALGEIADEDPEIVGLLIQLLAIATDAHRQVRANSATTLGHLGAAVAVDHLITALQQIS